ncbi:FecCD family ABC transporter permease [Eilatimonas milleporae]|uniref:Iron complex transport system permease protein n=1 Tax=Eilatimonas milleporae TaxID=911205 RepID=A0A3M0CCZ5_9PROT|nr:iron ABC transporter permease [Eilatimonas milleporae]RMB07704.1 iron complex transport system permease protein [Eilatimonas milleporae]
MTAPLTSPVAAHGVTAQGRPDQRDVRIALPKQPSGTAILWTLGALTAVMALANIAAGAYALSLWQILGAVARMVGVNAGGSVTDADIMILSQIRLPRVAIGLVVGAGLGVAGAVLQGLFRNPLAEPGLVGVSGGAALAAVSVIVFGGSTILLGDINITSYALPVAAFSGGLAATLFLFTVSRFSNGDPVATMLLVGIALNAITVAAIGAMQYVSDEAELRLLTFWMMGGLGSITWERALPAIFLVVPSVLWLVRLAPGLNAYQLGRDGAAHIGIDTGRLTAFGVIASALAVGASVAVTGIISFVGLMVPHLVRQIGSADHRFVLPASALLGSALVLGADLAARLSVAPAELPIGLVTSALGGPFFLWLILRRRSTNGGGSR